MSSKTSPFHLDSAILVCYILREKINALTSRPVGACPGARAIQRIKRLRPILALGLIAAIVLLVSGCARESYPQTTTAPVTDTASRVQGLYVLLFWAAMAVFVLVEGLLLFTVFRFRAKKGQTGIPDQVHGNTRLEILWTIVPVVILVVIAIPTYVTIAKNSADASPDALEVKVVGHQWWWEYQYPKLGITTANELYLPAGREVHLILQSADVIHSFRVPQLSGTQDVVPGRVNSLVFTINKDKITGDTVEFYGQCLELCGIAHANMRTRVFVKSETDFNTWAEDFKKPAAPPAGEAAKGQQLFSSKGCIACHTIAGNPVAVGKIGPNLTNLAMRTTIAAGVLVNDANGDNLRRWLTNPSDVKPGNIMTTAPVYNNPSLKLTDLDISALVAYLQSLKPAEGPIPPTATPAPTPTGGAVGTDRGKAVFLGSSGCFACHTVAGVSSGAIGPNLTTIGATAATRKPGTSAEAYIRESVLKPNAFIAPGFQPNLMPATFGESLSQQQLNDLVTFLLSLK